jgi:hypothetical protein
MEDLTTAEAVDVRLLPLRREKNVESSDRND